MVKKSILLRNLTEEFHTQLKVNAAQCNKTLEKYITDILQDVLKTGGGR